MFPCVLVVAALSGQGETVAPWPAARHTPSDMRADRPARSVNVRVIQLPTDPATVELMKQLLESTPPKK